ncbi:hypothetical protein DSI41_05635, partial [Mycobacterium tuberculosis]
MADTQDAAQAIAVAGELGRIDLLAGCLAALPREDSVLRFVAARAALLLGDRQEALRTLVALAEVIGPQQAVAVVLAL